MSFIIRVLQAIFSNILATAAGLTDISQHVENGEVNNRKLMIDVMLKFNVLFLDSLCIYLKFCKFLPINKH